MHFKEMYPVWFGVEQSINTHGERPRTWPQEELLFKKNLFFHLLL
jgi:hypothetical protein